MNSFIHLIYIHNPDDRLAKQRPASPTQPRLYFLEYDFLHQAQFPASWIYEALSAKQQLKAKSFEVGDVPAPKIIKALEPITMINLMALTLMSVGLDSIEGIHRILPKTKSIRLCRCLITKATTTSPKSDHLPRPTWRTLNG